MDYSLWTIDKEKPIYVQLLDNIKCGILSGRIQPGEYLPSIRDMAQLTHANPNTVARAYRELRKLKLLDSNRTNRFSVTIDIEYIKFLKEKTAREICSSYLTSMLGFGMTKTEIFDYINHFCDSL